MRFEVLKNDAGEYWWRMVGANGEILAHSQNYAAKVSAIDAINVVKSDASDAWVDDKTGKLVRATRPERIAPMRDRDTGDWTCSFGVSVDVASSWPLL